VAALLCRWLLKPWLFPEKTLLEAVF